MSGIVAGMLTVMIHRSRRRPARQTHEPFDETGISTLAAAVGHG